MKPIRVMLVDDSGEYRELIRSVLKMDGRCEVVEEASDGADAVLKTLRAKPDVVLLDLSLPVMDGLQALEAIKNAAPHCKVVICSAFDDTFGADAVEMGADERIGKGASLADLVEKLVAVAGTPIERKVVTAQEKDWVGRYLIAVLAREPRSAEEDPQ